MDHRTGTILAGGDNNWLKMQYSRDISNHQNDTEGSHIRTTIKPTSPPSRTSTGTTAALSSYSSHSIMTEATSSSGCSSPYQSTRRLVWLDDDGYGIDDHHDMPLEEPDLNIFSRLLCLSQRYRARCLQLVTRFQDKDARTSPCLLQDAIGISSSAALSQQFYRTLSRKTPAPLASVSTTRHCQARTPRQPVLPPLPFAGSSQDRKPPERKQSTSESTSFKTTPYQATKIATLPYRPFAAEAPMGSRELRHDTTEQFNLDAFTGLDAEDVRRQQEILEDIQERNRRAETAAPYKQPKVSRPGGVAADLNTRPSSMPLQQALHHNQERELQARRNSPLQQSSAVTRPPLPFKNAMVGDQLARLSNGKKIRIKSNRHTYKSIIQGKATLVQCPVCQTVSQISDTAKLLYCTACQQVSPIGTGTNAAGANSRTADPSAAAALACCDGQIACVLQRQEINVAHIMKQAKQIAG